MDKHDTHASYTGFSLKRFGLMDEDEYEIIQVNAGLTEEQVAAFRKALYELFGLPPDASGHGDSDDEGN